MIHNRLDHRLRDSNPILSIYLTAGYPALDDTVPLCAALEECGVDMIEVGIPFSDPVADGPVLQASSRRALQNGMSVVRLFDQLRSLRARVAIPVLIMTYLNPVMRFGIESFCACCAEVGVDGVIIPDLPAEEFGRILRPHSERYNLHNILLVAPGASPERITELDRLSSSFLYVVSSPGVTGRTVADAEKPGEFFRQSLTSGLRSPAILGFGIADRASFERVTKHYRGAIIGSAFVKALGQGGDACEAARKFIRTIKD